jgi:deglycase
MPSTLDGMRIGFLVANEGVEEVELTEPWDAVKAAGGLPQLVAPEPGEVLAMHHLDKADTFAVDLTTADADPADFDGIVLPGGVANPDRLRTDGPAVELLRRVMDAGKPVAAICHGPWSLVETGMVPGRTLTSWPSLATDIRNAGGRWVDEEVVVCSAGPGSLVTSRKPDDLPAFCRTVVEVFALQRQ